MKKKQFEALCRKALLPSVPGFDCRGWLLYERPVVHLLRGFCCEDSAFDASTFTINVFVLPLYIPTNHIYFNFGGRLKDDRGCAQWWNIKDENCHDDVLMRFKKQGIPFLNTVDSPKALAKAASSLPAQQCFRWEVIAYSQAITGQVAAALSALDRLARTVDATVHWQAEKLERAKLLRMKLEEDPQSAKQQLWKWEEESIAHLGLVG